MRTAIVTGAGSGMGRATAQRFLREGWTVIGLDLAPTDLGTDTDTDSDSDSGRGLTAIVDVRDRTAVGAALAELVPRAGGAVHAVANVAGIYPPTTLSTYTEELYRRVFDVNVLGTLNVTAEAVPYMPEQSAIVNFASVDGLAVSPGQLLYCASKAAVIMLTRSLALELAPRRIRVNAIAPGWIDTPANRATGRMQAAADAIPLGRVGLPAEVAEWVWRLAGAGVAGYVTGTTINISGGEHV
jgi:3-oxoacyl-[acyl-carrier protein] reductase